MLSIKKMMKSLPKIYSYLSQKRLANLSYFDFLILFLAASLGIYLSWTVFGSLFLAFVILAILLPLSSSQLAKTTLFLLVIMSILLIMKSSKMSEQFGIFAFLTFSLTVISAISERSKEQKNK